MADAMRPPPHWGLPGSEVPAQRGLHEEWGSNLDWANRPEFNRPEFQSGIIVRNTFIDVCPLEEESDDNDGSCASPHRRNLSAPPSPTRNRGAWPEPGMQFEDSDQEEEEDPGAIPNYEWGADGGIVSADMADGQTLQSGQKDGNDVFGTAPPNLPTWLRGPPGSPKRVVTRPKKKRSLVPEGQQRPALGEFLKGESSDLLHHTGLGADSGDLGLSGGLGSASGGIGLGAGLGQGAGGLGLGAGPAALGPSGLDAGAGFGFGQMHGLDPRLSGMHPGYGAGLGAAAGMPYTGLESAYDPRVSAVGHDMAGLATSPPIDPYRLHDGRNYAAGYGGYGMGQDLFHGGCGMLTHEHLATMPPLYPQGPPFPDSREQDAWALGGQQSESWPHGPKGAPPLLPPDLSTGAAYISDNPPPHDPLGGHIPTEAPAYILGTASVKEDSLSRPPPPQQPPPQVSADASGRLPCGGNLQHPLWGTTPLNTAAAEGSTLSTKPPTANMAGVYGTTAAGHCGAEGMPAFQIACGTSSVQGGYHDRYMDHFGSRAVAGTTPGAGGAAVGAERGRGGYPGGRGGQGANVRATEGTDTFSTTPLHNVPPPGTPWISPNAVAAHGPWIHPSAQGKVAAADKKAEAMGRRGADGGHDGADGQTKADKGGRVPLSGGGPKRTDYIKKYGGAQENEIATVPITTMMLKNIPCRKSQEEVMMHIDQKGFGNKYDFFYLPRDVKFRANLGYAFINFITPEDAAQFGAEMNGYRFNGSGSTKACAIVPAHVQGLMNNLAAFKRTEVMRSSRKPYFSGVVTP